MVIGIYVGYSFFFISRDNNAELSSYFQIIAFEVFLLCDFGMVTLILYNQSKLHHFLKKHPVITHQSALEELKVIARTNMYSAFSLFFFLGIGSLSAVTIIFNPNTDNTSLVSLLLTITTLLMAWYNLSEQKIKQIHCTNQSLEAELNAILDCWMNKAFPNF